MDNKTVKICAIGLKTQLQRTLELVFEYKVKDFALSTERDAHAYIFDFDNIQAKEYWQTHRQRFPHIPNIILSSYDNVAGEQLFVKKPITFSAFFSVLEQLKNFISQSTTLHPPPKKEEQVFRIHSSKNHPDEKQVITQSSVQLFEKQQDNKTSTCFTESVICGLELDINPHDHKVLQKIIYDPSQYLQGLIEKALETAKNAGCFCRLKGTTDELLLDPVSHQVFYYVNKATLQHLMLLPTKNLYVETQLLSPHQAEEYLSHVSPPLYRECLEYFLWKVAILTAHGRIPIGTDLNAPVVLLRWPNFSRLMITPHALQIAALWANSHTPISLIETSTLLHIPQRYVFSLYSALHALKLARIASGTSSTSCNQLISLTSNADKRGLFQRLLAKLSF